MNVEEISGYHSHEGELTAVIFVRVSPSRSRKKRSESARPHCANSTAFVPGSMPPMSPFMPAAFRRTVVSSATFHASTDRRFGDERLHEAYATHSSFALGIH